MPDRKKLIEHGKSLLIVLLIISAVFLLYETGYFSGAFERLGLKIQGSQEGAVSSETMISGEQVSGNIRAMEISVSARDGHRYSAMYEKERVEEDYSRFSAFLAEALGTASPADAVDEARWVKALEGEGAYIRYFAPMPLAFLSARLGTEFNGENAYDMAEEFCLCSENGAVTLYYRSGEGFYCCATKVSSAALAERIGEYISNDSFFTHSDSLLSGMKESMLVMKSVSEVPAIKGAGVNSSAYLEDLMLSLGINEYTASNYFEGSGTSVYVDGNSVLRISPSGYVLYELSGDKAISANDGSFGSVLQLCWNLAQTTVGENCEGAEIYMSALEREDDGRYLVVFDYLMEGIPVYTGVRHAASFTVFEGRLESAEFYYRAYSLTGQQMSVLPMYQAAAIASSKQCEKLGLAYSDTQEIIECVWVNE